FLAVSLLKNAGESQIAGVSQVGSDEPAAAAPNLDYAANYYNSNASAANSSTTAANTMANAANRGEDAAHANKAVIPVSPLPEATADAKPQNPSIAADGVSGRQAAPPTAPQQSPVERPAALADKNDVALAEEKRNVREQEVSKEKDELKSRSETALLNPGGPSKLMKGPARKAATPESAMTSGRRTVSGRSFELKQGVWYDSTYRGQGTTNIRRGTEQYKKIGGGLRAIGEGISGTVVTVWNGKAYRID
ncbi:MAG: hypothetical protein ABIU09_03550, partial [Pyrinomonadaceae bacterium]